MACHASHYGKRVAARIWPGRRAGEQKPDRNLGMPGSNLSSQLESGICVRAGAEEDYVVGIVEMEEALQKLAQAGLGSVQRLEQAHLGQKFLRDRKSFTGLKTNCRDYRHAQKDCGG